MVQMSRLGIIGMGVILFFSPHGFGANLPSPGKTDISLPIEGHYPYMHSVAAKISDEGNYIFDLDEQPLVTVGSLVYLPNLDCHINEGHGERELYRVRDDNRSPFFIYMDQDNDACFVEESQLTWYLLDPKGQPWDTITQWEDLEATEITRSAFPGSLIPPDRTHLSTKTDLLVVPAEAKGKRIGFIYTPHSATGQPSSGSPIKVWDLNYIFGQNEPPYKGSVQKENYGVKHTRMREQSAGGEVLAPISRPKIENLKLEGQFRPTGRLTAVYDFVVDNNLPYENRSKFWWGPKGTTKVLAENNAAGGLTSPISRPISLTNVGSVFEVSAKPIKLQQDKFVHGEVVTTTTAEFPDILVPPTVSALRIYYVLEDTYFPPYEGLYVGAVLSGQYTFNPGSNNVDRSTYTWQHKGSGLIRQEGLTSTNPNPNNPYAIIPYLIVNSTDTGEVLVLSVTAKDIEGRVGNTMTAETQRVSLAPNVENVTFYFEPGVAASTIAPGAKIAGRYDFIEADSPIDRSVYDWRHDGSDVVIAEGNGIDLEPAHPVNKAIPAYEVQESDVGQVLRLTVTPIDGLGLIGDPESITTGIIQEDPVISDLTIHYRSTGGSTQMPVPVLRIGEVIWGTYQFRSDNNATDRSTYQVRRVLTGAVVASGQTQPGAGNNRGQTPDYTIVAADAGRTLALSVTARDSNNVQGNTLTQITQTVISTNQMPKLNNFGISYHSTGTAEPPVYGFTVDDSVSLSYEFESPNNAQEASEIRWTIPSIGRLVQEGKITGTPADETLMTFKATPSLVGYSLEVTVTPVDTRGFAGTASRAGISQIVRKPYVQNVAITYSRTGQSVSDDMVLSAGEFLLGSYEYTHGNNVGDNSNYQWFELSESGWQPLTEIQSTVGGIAPLEIKPEFNGKSLRLMIYPLDASGRPGDEAYREVFNLRVTQ